jgi:hypothetical protein
VGRGRAQRTGVIAKGILGAAEARIGDGDGAHDRHLDQRPNGVGRAELDRHRLGLELLPLRLQIAAGLVERACGGVQVIGGDGESGHRR